MAAGPDETGFLKTVLEWAWAVVGVLMGIIWKKHNEEIASIKASIQKVGESKVNEKTFDEYVERAEKDRDERRETEINLFAEIKDQRNHFDSKLDRLAELIRANK